MLWQGYLIIFSVLAIIAAAILLGIFYPRGNTATVTVTPTVSPTSSPTITPSDFKYTLVDNLTGKDILDTIGTNFDYFTEADPTHGYVNYGAHSDLLEVVESTKLKINMGTNIGNPRNSIRLERKSLFDSGLVVLDIDHVPADLSSWPAFWTTGHVDPPSSWAFSGESDILEQVNNSTFNTSTLHTSTRPGGTPCEMAPDLGFNNAQCFAVSGDKTCGYNSSDYCPYVGCNKDMGPNTFGSALNSRGGGTFAMQLTAAGSITVWFWDRDATVPDFSTATNSDFSSTSTIQFSTCANQFSQQRVIINTTLCGDWAGASCCDGDHTWDNNAGCINWVNTHNLDDSFWVIRYFQFYRLNY